MNWSDHVRDLSRKFYSTLHGMMRLKHFLPITAKVQLVNTLLLPIIDYGDVCYVDANEDLVNKLERLLNMAIRFIFNLRKFDHVSSYRSRLKWLTIRGRRSLRVLCMLYSILNNGKYPDYLFSKFLFRADAHDRQLRSSENLLLTFPSHRSGFMSNSFVVTAVRLWNGLPEAIRKAPSKDSFKIAVKKYLLNQENIGRKD